MPQRHHLASGSFWDSERLFGEDGDPANLEHQAASGAILPYMASAVPNVDVGLSSRPIKNHCNFFSAGTQSPTNNILLCCDEDPILPTTRNMDTWCSHQTEMAAPSLP